MRFIATCKMGLESVVSLELKWLGIEVEKVEDARVLFLGGYEDMARACLWLRSAERVLMEVSSFEARTFEELGEISLEKLPICGGCYGIRVGKDGWVVSDGGKEVARGETDGKRVEIGRDA